MVYTDGVLAIANPAVLLEPAAFAALFVVGAVMVMAGLSLRHRRR